MSQKCTLYNCHDSFNLYKYTFFKYLLIHLPYLLYPEQGPKATPSKLGSKAGEFHLPWQVAHIHTLIPRKMSLFYNRAKPEMGKHTDERRVQTITPARD